MITTVVDKIIKIKIKQKTLEGMRRAKTIEGKTNKIPHKTLEGIRAAKLLNIFNIYIALAILKNKKKNFLVYI